MGELQEAAWRPVLAGLVGEVASCAPAHWCSASFVIRYDKDRMRCELSDGTGRHHVAPTPWLVTLAHDLHTKMAKSRCGWNSALIRIAFFAARTHVDLEIDALLKEKALSLPGAQGSHWSVVLACARAAA